MNEPTIDALLAALLIIIVAAFVGVRIYARSGRPTLSFARRVENWWLLWLLLVFAYLTGKPGSIIAFALLSLLSLREFITLAPTGRGDHRALFWSFFFVTPLQYALIWIDVYPLFSLLIPVYGGMAVAARTMLAGHTENFLQRVAMIQWALLTCVYCLSYAPALYLVEFDGRTPGGFGAMLFIFIVASLMDLVQGVVTPLLPRHVVSPRVSAHKTWEGLVVSTLVLAAVSGFVLAWLVELDPLPAALVGGIIAGGSFFSELVLSAVKRDRGVPDYRRLGESTEMTVEVHGAVLDRIGALVFAAPVGYHLLVVAHKVWG